MSVLLLVNLTLNLAGCRSFVPFENSLFHQDWVTVLNWPLLMHHPFLSSLSLYACKIITYDLSEEKFDFLPVRYVETSRLDLPDDCCSPINFPMLKVNTKSIKGHEVINWYSVVEICKNCRVYFCWKSLFFVTVSRIKKTSDYSKNDKYYKILQLLKARTLRGSLQLSYKKDIHSLDPNKNHIFFLCNNNNVFQEI